MTYVYVLWFAGEPHGYYSTLDKAEIGKNEWLSRLPSCFQSSDFEITKEDVR